MKKTLTANQKKKLMGKLVIAHYNDGTKVSGIVKAVGDDHVILAPKGGKAEIKAFFADGFFPGFGFGFGGFGFNPFFFPGFFI